MSMEEIIDNYKIMVKFMRKEREELRASNKRLRELIESLLAANRSN